MGDHHAADLRMEHIPTGTVIYSRDHGQRSQYRAWKCLIRRLRSILWARRQGIVFESPEVVRDYTGGEWVRDSRGAQWCTDVVPQAPVNPAAEPSTGDESPQA